jgi:putative oxidoreductase
MTTLTQDQLSVSTSRGLIASALATSDSLPLAVIRIALAVVIFPHGAQKLFGWFGGYGLNGTLGFFASLGVPAALGILGILAESAGAVALAAGLATRLSALGIGLTVGMGALLVHAKNGFFMNWSGAQAGEGFEYHILVAGAALALVIGGAGRWSADRAIAGR